MKFYITDSGDPYADCIMIHSTHGESYVMERLYDTDTMGGETVEEASEVICGLLESLNIDYTVAMIDTEEMKGLFQTSLRPMNAPQFIYDITLDALVPYRLLNYLDTRNHSIKMAYIGTQKED